MNDLQRTPRVIDDVLEHTVIDPLECGEHRGNGRTLSDERRRLLRVGLAQEETHPDLVFRKIEHELRVARARRPRSADRAAWCHLHARAWNVEVIEPLTDSNTATLGQESWPHGFR